MCLITASLAGVIGFTCGAILTRPDREKAEKAINDAKQEIERLTIISSKTQQDQRAKDKSPKSGAAKCIFDMTKPELIKYFKKKNLHVGPEAYMKQKNLTVFPLEGEAVIKVTWREPDCKYIDGILIVNSTVEHSEFGAKPVLKAWKKIQPDMIQLFGIIKSETPKEFLSSKLRWYDGGPYAYGISKNNKYYVDYIGPKEAIPGLKKQSIECAIICLGWFHKIESSQKRFKEEVNSGISESKLYEKLIDKLDLIATEFGNVHIYDMGKDFQIYNVDYFYSCIPPAFDDEAKTKLLKVAGAVYRLAFFSQQLLKKKKSIDFVAYNELIGAVLEANVAIRSIWGKYSRLEGYEKFSKLPKEYEDRFNEMSVLAYAIQVNR